MQVDSHTHIFPPEVIARKDRYLRADARFAELYSNPSSKLATAENLIDSMDISGIDTSIACGFSWGQQDLCNDSNDYILDSVKRYPGRLIGLANLRPEAGDAALYNFERCVQGGIKGIGELRPSPGCLDTGFDSLWTPVARILADRGLLCLFHSSEPVGHPYPGKSSLTPQVLYPFIKRYPEVRFILAHWGGGLPFYALMPEVKKALSNTWFDTAASSYLYDRSIYEQVIRLVGSDRVLFGSDYPLLPQKRCIQDIINLGLPEEDSLRILGLNAMKLFAEKDAG